MPTASFEIRHSPTTAATITAAAVLLLSAFAAPCTGFTQSAAEPLAKNAAQQHIVDEIQQEQDRNGVYSPALIEPWSALALLYQEDGSRAPAIAAIEQARQVIRVNYGLRSMKEAPLIRLEIQIDKAGGDAETAWDLEQKLLTLISKYPEDMGGVPILREVGDERLDWLRLYRAGESPPQIGIGCYYERRVFPRGSPSFPAAPGPSPDPFRLGSCSAGSSTTVIVSLFAEAKLYYEQAIGVLVRNRRYSSGELRDLEAQLIRTSFSSRDYVEGKQSYRRLIGYNAATEAPWPARVGTFVEMTDWDLLFSLHVGTDVLDSIDAAYEQAYDVLYRKAVPQASIDELFSPKVPVVLPSFLPNPLISKPSSGSRGYIDVAFDIGKYGNGEHVKVVGATADATSADKRDLVRIVKRSVFRPIVTNGRIADAFPVVVRYYLEQGRESSSETSTGQDQSGPLGRGLSARPLEASKRVALP
ncbi:MAG TPA: hypothetical protein VFY39_06510 [Gammaproteobacteria bacterium]|nr:hypothetical protein [Gammaproteobacteria bacterium]